MNSTEKTRREFIEKVFKEYEAVLSEINHSEKNHEVSSCQNCQTIRAISRVDISWQKVSHLTAAILGELHYSPDPVYTLSSALVSFESWTIEATRRTCETQRLEEMLKT